MAKTQLHYEVQLGSFDYNERRDVLKNLNILLRSGQVAVVPEQPIVNLHSHTFYSFNAYNYSPSALSWEAKKRGLYAVGIVDHEVLSGVEEFLDACDLLGIRGVGGIETRVFIPEWSDRDINFPGEPGVCGILGCGFTSGTPPEGSESQKLLQRMACSARERNETLVQKLNDYLGDLNISYEDEVLPLVPAGGNATERHILLTLESKSRDLFPEKEIRARFWAETMGVKKEKVLNLLDNPADLQLLIRAKLMKQGSPCYTPATEGSFPPLSESVRMMLELGAVPVGGWVDGISEGERDTAALISWMVESGMPALGIIPDRNWNIADTEKRQVKVNKLHEIINEAVKREMIILVGTDMSKLGQKFVDDFNADPMKPFIDEFVKGARIMIGHTRVRKYKGIGLLSGETTERFKGDLKKRNAFFEKVGCFKPPESPEEHTALKLQIEKEWEKARISLYTNEKTYSL